MLRSVRFLSLLALSSILTISFSYGLTSEEKAALWEKNYEKIDVKAIADSFMKGGEPTEPIDINAVGYDLHTDYYFFKFKRQDFAAKNFAKRKVISAGTQRDAVGHQATRSLYPFIVSQKSTSNVLYSALYRDTTTDRFDVKEDQNGNQYVGLYDGHNGNRVVNKVRGLLLRKVVNAVKDLLPLLDKVTHPLIKFQEEPDVIAAAGDYAEMFRNEIGRIIKSVFAQVDQDIQGPNPRSDAKSGAAASVVIITKYNLIVAWLGNVRVLTYDEDLKTNRVTNDHSVFNLQEVKNHIAKGYQVCTPLGQLWFEACTLTRSFASTDRKTRRYHEAESEVKFIPRYFFDGDDDDEEDQAMMSTQFVVLETASIATRVSDIQVSKRITKAAKDFRDRPEMENTMYNKMVDDILNDVLEVPSVKKDTTDFSVLIVGLEKDDYTSVH